MLQVQGNEGSRMLAFSQLHSDAVDAAKLSDRPLFPAGDDNRWTKSLDRKIELEDLPHEEEKTEKTMSRQDTNMSK